jgi:glycosyltransferase involved in cell wall biosynthesis
VGGNGPSARRTVLFLHSSAGRYGADMQLLLLAGGVDRSRWRPVVVLPERGALAGPLEESGVGVYVHPLAVLRRGLASPRGAASVARRLVRDRRTLSRLARRLGTAIVHSNTSVVLAGQAVARRSGARHVLHLREIYEGAGGRAGALLWPLMRRRLLDADAIACISDAVAAQLRPAPHVHVVSDGLARVPRRIDRSRARAALGVPVEPFAVALLGRVSDWKGQDVLARALAEPALADIGAVGLVAGDAFPGNERYELALDRLRERLDLGDRLRLLGFRDDVETVLGAADAVAVPSRRPEPLGLVALEAAAIGLPVVAAAHGGLTEALRDGETGLLVPPGDHRALARALRELADHPDLGRRLGSAAARDVRERFAPERTLAEVELLYDRLLSGAGVRRTPTRRPRSTPPRPRRRAR